MDQKIEAERKRLFNKYVKEGTSQRTLDKKLRSDVDAFRKALEDKAERGNESSESSSGGENTEALGDERLFVPAERWWVDGLLSDKSKDAQRGQQETQEMYFMLEEAEDDKAAPEAAMSADAKSDQCKWPRMCNAPRENTLLEQYGKLYAEQTAVTDVDIHHSIRNNLRSNLYMYGVRRDDVRGESQLRKGYVELSKLGLDNQERQIGRPMHTAGWFMRQCAYPTSMSRPSGGMGPPTVEPGATLYHRANKYRMEVLRLWWKLFKAQGEQMVAMQLSRGRVTDDVKRGDVTYERFKDRQELHAGEISDEQGRDGVDDANEEANPKDESPHNKPLAARTQLPEVPNSANAEVSKATVSDEALFNKALDRLIGNPNDAEKEKDEGPVLGPPMVLSVLTLGRKRLAVGVIAPEFEKQGRNYVPVKQHVEYYGGRVEDDDVGQVEVRDQETWPLLPIGYNTTWAQHSRDVPMYNRLMYFILNVIFGEKRESESGWKDILNDFEWRVGSLPKTLVDAFSDAVLGHRQGFSELEIIRELEDLSASLVASAPYWVQKFLSSRLVDDAQHQEEIEVLTAPLQKGIEDATLTLQVAAKTAAEVSKTDSRRADVRDVHDAVLHNQILEAEQNLRKLQAELDEKRNLHKLGSFLWNAYPTAIPTRKAELDRDSTVPDMTWAHQQLVRSVVSLQHTAVGTEAKLHEPAYWLEESEMRGTNANGDGTAIKVVTVNRRNEYGERIDFGNPDALSMYTQWYRETVLGEEHGQIGQTVVLVNMLMYGKSQPWYMQAQGMAGVIVDKDELPSDKYPGVEYNATQTTLATIYKVRTDLLVPGDQLSEFKRAGRCTVDGLAIVSVFGENLWPLGYKEQLRYGDRFTFDFSKLGSCSAQQIEIMRSKFADTKWAAVDINWYGPSSKVRDAVNSGISTKQFPDVWKNRKKFHNTVKAVKYPTNVEDLEERVGAPYYYDTPLPSVGSDKGVRKRNPRFLRYDDEEAPLLKPDETNQVPEGLTRTLAKACTVNGINMRFVKNLSLDVQVEKV